MIAALSRSREFDAPERCACRWCSGSVACERDDDGEPVLSHSAPPCARFAGADEPQLLREFRDAVRAAPWR